METNNSGARTDAALLLSSTKTVMARRGMRGRNSTGTGDQLFGSFGVWQK